MKWCPGGGPFEFDVILSIGYLSIISFFLGTLQFKIAAIASIVFQGFFLYRSVNAQDRGNVIYTLCFAFCAFLVAFLISLYA